MKDQGQGLAPLSIYESSYEAYQNSNTQLMNVSWRPLHIASSSGDSNLEGLHRRCHSHDE